MYKVLIVDDSQTMRSFLEEILRDRAKCDSVHNGQEALKAYIKAIEENDHYDLILLDLSMPDIHGLEVLNIIREKEREANIPSGYGVPVIIITSNDKLSKQAFEQGCDDYIVKPVNAEELLRKIDALINKK